MQSTAPLAWERLAVAVSFSFETPGGANRDRAEAVLGQALQEAGPQADQRLL
jgi:hypothetical protein